MTNGAGPARGYLSEKDCVVDRATRQFEATS